MDRRAWLIACAALLECRLPAAAQGARPRIAVLSGSSPDANLQRELVDGLREGLAAQGLVDGRNVELHFRWAEGKPERLPGLLDELLRLQPAVLVAAGPRPVIVARDAKVTVPVVAVPIDDPVEMGLAKTAARPEGRFTGLSAAFDGILQRRLQLLADLVPRPRRFAVLANPMTVRSVGLREALNSVESSLGAPLPMVEASAPVDFEAAFNTLARERSGWSFPRACASARTR